MLQVREPDAEPPRHRDDDGMPLPPWTRQAASEVRFDWGPVGVEAVHARYVVIVDVLRFTTAVDAAVARGARVYPYRWKDASAASFAQDVGARLADGSDPAGPSLSPVAMTRVDHGDALVLPSPNGSTCATLASERGATVIAACLRNARSVAAWLNANTREVAVIACGERWPDGGLRPALEDHLGAGAVLAHLKGHLSREAEAAVRLWEGMEQAAADAIRECVSGQELQACDRGDDLEFAVALHVSATVPLLSDGAFLDAARQ
jgi:2-phosphosulfolactate phosphatase